MNSANKAVAKSLVKVSVIVALSWLATSSLDGELQVAATSVVAAVANALYSWLDPKDTRYGVGSE